MTVPQRARCPTVARPPDRAVSRAVLPPKGPAGPGPRTMGYNDYQRRPLRTPAGLLHCPTALPDCPGGLIVTLPSHRLSQAEALHRGARGSYLDSVGLPLSRDCDIAARCLPRRQSDGVSPVFAASSPALLLGPQLSRPALLTSHIALSSLIASPRSCAGAGRSAEPWHVSSGSDS
jgi:hypothetical protein